MIFDFFLKTEDGRERNIGLLFLLVVHSLVASSCALLGDGTGDSPIKTML